MRISDWSSDVCSSDLKLVGAKTSRICRAADSTMSSWCLLTPPIPVVAACHHCWFSKKAWTIRLKGGSFHAGSVNRRSWRRGSIAGAAPGSLRLRQIHSDKRQYFLAALAPSCSCLPGDRTSVVEGKRGCERVNRGGYRV